MIHDLRHIYRYVFLRNVSFVGLGVFFCALAGLLHNKNLNAAKYAYSFCSPKKTPDRGIYKTTEQFVNSHGHHQLNKNKYWSLFLTNAFTDVFQTNPFDGALAFISFYLYIYISTRKPNIKHQPQPLIWEFRQRILLGRCGSLHSGRFRPVIGGGG